MDDFPDYGQQQEAERERWMRSIDALLHCKERGVPEEDLEHLAREAGIDIRHIERT